eukprot:9504069-Pyramimonas_sp.AAC.1
MSKPTQRFLARDASETLRSMRQHWHDQQQQEKQRLTEHGLGGGSPRAHSPPISWTPRPTGGAHSATELRGGEADEGE